MSAWYVCATIETNEKPVQLCLKMKEAEEKSINLSLNVINKWTETDAIGVTRRWSEMVQNYGKSMRRQWFHTKMRLRILSVAFGYASSQAFVRCIQLKTNDEDCEVYRKGARSWITNWNNDRNNAKMQRKKNEWESFFLTPVAIRLLWTQGCAIVSVKYHFHFV